MTFRAPLGPSTRTRSVPKGAKSVRSVPKGAKSVGHSVKRHLQHASSTSTVTLRKSGSPSIWKAPLAAHTLGKPSPVPLLKPGWLTLQVDRSDPSHIINQSNSHCVHSMCQLEGYCQRATLVRPRSPNYCGGPAPPSSNSCGSKPHCKRIPACPKPKLDPAKGSPSAPRRVSHGLTATHLSQAKHLAAVKLLTMPARADIPDDAEYLVRIEGETVGKYCRHCGRFVFGASQHFTKEHQGKSNFPYKGGTDAVSYGPIPTLLDLEKRDTSTLLTVPGKV